MIMAEKKKLRIGIFSFTGDEGCVIVLEELLNKYLFDWKDLVEIKAARVLQTKLVIEDIDVAFVEGAIATEKEEKRVKRIRANCKKLVAIGSCAIHGDPSNHRNFFDPERLKEIELVIERFHHLDKVHPLKDFVKVDAEIPGCPMLEKGFLDTVNNALAEFGIIKKPQSSGGTYAQHI